MKKRVLSLVCIITIVLYACLAFSEVRNHEYELLKRALGLSKHLIIAKFRHNVPKEFNAKEFLDIVKNKIPDDSYNALRRFPIEVVPKGSYYLPKVFEPEDNKLILISNSCETGS